MKKLLIVLLGLTIAAASMAQQSNATTTKPFQVSFLPGFGTAGINSKDLDCNFSFNIIGGNIHGLNGFEIGGVFNIEHGYMKGSQISGVSNLIGGNIDGIQIAGVHNTGLGTLKGAQLAGVSNIIKGTAQGGQISGVFNAAKSIAGVQLTGVANFTLDSAGTQIAGVTNFSKVSKGLQLSGVVNVATERMEGAQISGVINVSKNVKGLQLGVINIADSVDGVTIGLFNFIRSGVHSVELSHEDIMDYNFTYRGGTDRLYSLVSFGIKSQQFWSSGAGLGTSFNTPVPNLLASIEASTHMIQLTQRPQLRGEYSLNKVQLTAGYRLNKYISVYGGPSLNIFLAELDDDPTDNPIANLGPDGFNHRTYNNGNELKMWIGYKVGLRFF
ncbi:MAG: hypothetical protein JXQ90_23850 [Cyclobacteriaceae bacterium]